jgi:C1A family cysteine protease
MFAPVAAGFPVYASSEPYFWRKVMNYLGGHCVTIVGYTPEGFIIRNSWGKRWMHKGHITIPYNEYEDTIFEAWTMTF